MIFVLQPHPLPSLIPPQNPHHHRYPDPQRYYYPHRLLLPVTRFTNRNGARYSSWYLVPAARILHQLTTSTTISAIHTPIISAATPRSLLPSSASPDKTHPDVPRDACPSRYTRGIHPPSSSPLPSADPHSSASP